MAAKKDFAGMNTARADIGRVQNTIAQATSRKGQQTTATEEEAAARREEMRTQGRKGAKSKRINLAFSDSNYEFITVLAQATGHTFTQFCNLIIANYRNEHPELVEKAKAVIEFANSDIFTQGEES